MTTQDANTMTAYLGNRYMRYDVSRISEVERGVSPHEILEHIMIRNIANAFINVILALGAILGVIKVLIGTAFVIIVLSIVCDLAGVNFSTVATVIGLVIGSIAIIGATHHA